MVRKRVDCRVGVSFLNIFCIVVIKEMYRRNQLECLTFLHSIVNSACNVEVIPLVMWNARNDNSNTVSLVCCMQSG